MSFAESLSRNASRELPCSRQGCGSQVSHDIYHNCGDFEDLDNMEEDDGGWCKLPSQRWKSIQQSQSLSESTSFLVSLYLRKRNLENKVMSVSEC